MPYNQPGVHSCVWSAIVDAGRTSPTRPSRTKPMATAEGPPREHPRFAAIWRGTYHHAVNDATPAPVHLAPRRCVGGALGLPDLGGNKETTMSDQNEQGHLWLRADDGAEVFVHLWLPETAAVSGVVQIVHGAAEHAGRYDRLASDLISAGFAVYASDDRGHGRTAGSVQRLGLAGPDGWNRMVADERALTAHAKGAHPASPIVLLGHSMGSFIAQAYAQRCGDELAGLVLSGTGRRFPPARRISPPACSWRSSRTVSRHRRSTSPRCSPRSTSHSSRRLQHRTRRGSSG